MNREQFKGQWTTLKGKVKQKWGKLTDNDLLQIDGKYEEFIGKLQKLYGIQKEAAEKEFAAWEKSISVGAGHTSTGSNVSGSDTTRGSHGSFGSDTSHKGSKGNRS